MGRKHCGKRRNCSIRVISPFPTDFSKDMQYRHIKTRAVLGKGYTTEKGYNPVINIVKVTCPVIAVKKGGNLCKKNVWNYMASWCDFLYR